jgi:RNA polymerase sigma-70 factor (ECF subfamily)
MRLGNFSSRTDTTGEKVDVTTDEQLMADVRGGSRDAFAALFDRYRDAVWRFFRRRVPDRGRAEELTQDTFVAILEGAGRYEARGPFRSYLFGVAFNILLSDRRKSAAHPSAPLGDAAAVTVDRDTTVWIQSALARLDADDRELLMLREYEELSYLEIAHVLSLPINTVRSRLFRARMSLKDVLEAQGTVGVRHAVR